ncbi:hypothetical protein BDM02DRAFT_3154289 [Thelephora ganbajun]|uniref:Uncharacterized protein n=1 Tax=Thelephora ganbajun TaxID=370292 RepID=A0ACB6ZPF7_THEGA|nr:hypothetical protein BDM02DRAFT_3154289 [Thelephora ganbajun]
MATTGTSVAPAWKQFAFFDLVPVKDANDLTSSPAIFKNPFEIATVAPSSVGILVADVNGQVYILDKYFETIRTWVVHVSGRVTHMVERKGILVTLGEEDTVRHPILKIWDLETIDKKSDSPILLRSTKISHSAGPHPVSTVALSNALTYLAVGLANGTVLLYRQLDQSIFSGSTSLTALPKPKVVRESPTEPVTGLGFKEPTEENPNIYLFIVTINNVLSYQASGKGSGGTPAVVDQVGAGLGSATLNWRSKEMIVARDEAVYVVGTEGRGACYAYEGTKSSVYTHTNYLVIISPPFTPTATSSSATVRNFVARGQPQPNTDIAKVTVFDPENKLVAFSGTFAQGVREIVSQWGDIYILSNDGKLSCLQEKPTAAKLDMLYRKSLYLIALNLGKTQNLDEASVADIHRQYGDHLYSKGDYDGAMKQFVKTIGNVQPSYVIRKFLDAQRIHNLVTYLQELHAMGLANSDHTTLLLNTYTKLKDVARLDSFIKTESKRSDLAAAGGNGDPSEKQQELPFDLDTAIRVCRQAGYFDHASYLAKKYERHEDYLRIQIEDAGNHKLALAYLRRLGPETAETNLARYGRAMLENLPQETTELLIDICTSNSLLTIDDTANEAGEDPVLSSARRQSGFGPSYLSYLALNRGPTTNETATTVTGTTGTVTVKGRREGSILEDLGDSTPPPTASLLLNTGGAAATVQPPKPRELVKRPSPKVYFAHFVDHMEQFIIFLETVALRRWGQSVDGSPSAAASGEKGDSGVLVDEAAERADQISVWNTLLELYLSIPTKPGEEEKGMRVNALKLLQSDKIPYDINHALIVCSTCQFTPGLVLLWEKLGMHEDVLRFWMEKEKVSGSSGDENGASEASKQVVHYLDLHGPKHRHLYPLVLRFLTSSEMLLNRHSEDVERVIEYVDEEKIMPPLAILQLLSRNGITSIGLIKGWLVRKIEEAREDIDTDSQLTTSYRLETKAKLGQVQELSDPDQPKVFHATQCSTCGGQLDLPSVHFMCNHSYHQRCLADNETECPNCIQSHGVIREIRVNNARLANQHDLFLSEVKENGFRAVASAFGRGALNFTTFVSS